MKFISWNVNGLRACVTKGFADYFNAADADIFAIQETKLFFCDPFQSSQKPYVEKNHTVLRDYIPKGTSLDDYTQDTIDLRLSHMNSIARKSLNGKTPYEMFTFIFGAQLTDLLNIQKIEPENVIQSPVLIK